MQDTLDRDSRFRNARYGGEKKEKGKLGDYGAGERDKGLLLCLFWGLVAWGFVCGRQSKNGGNDGGKQLLYVDDCGDLFNCVVLCCVEGKSNVALQQ